ncbi:MAG: hypothetical protein H6581_10830 [Bacteroidia bacterium]|nr:hypothetical protein [Bacteroidia bacterium]
MKILRITPIAFYFLIPFWVGCSEKSPRIEIPISPKRMEVFKNDLQRNMAGVIIDSIRGLRIEEENDKYNYFYLKVKSEDSLSEISEITRKCAEIISFCQPFRIDLIIDNYEDSKEDFGYSFNSQTQQISIDWEENCFDNYAPVYKEMLDSIGIWDEVSQENQK